MSIEDPVEISKKNMLQLQLLTRSAWPMTTWSSSRIGRDTSRENRDEAAVQSYSGCGVSSLLFMPERSRCLWEALRTWVSEEELKIVLQGIFAQRLIAGYDFATENRQNWQPLEQMDLLAQSGYIQRLRRRPKKLSTSKQSKSLNCFESLFEVVFICLRSSFFWFALTLVEKSFGFPRCEGPFSGAVFQNDGWGSVFWVRWRHNCLSLSSITIELWRKSVTT